MDPYGGILSQPFYVELAVGGLMFSVVHAGEEILICWVYIIFAPLWHEVALPAGLGWQW